jgi:hypothetical protein
MAGARAQVIIIAQVPKLKPHRPRNASFAKTAGGCVRATLFRDRGATAAGRALDFLLFGFVCAFSCSSASAKTCRGTVQLSGGALHCAAHAGTLMTVSLAKCRFADSPRDVITTGHAVDRENSVLAKATSWDENSFVATVTTTGQHANEVCSNTWFDWEATE